MKQMYKKFVKMPATKGFTLVELLVVISIIALLLSILMPSLNVARKQAQTLICGTRQKDLGLAFNLYVGDNNQELPASLQYDPPNSGKYGRWVTKLAPYYSQAKNALKESGGRFAGVYIDMYRCPTQEKKYSVDDAVGTYGYNMYLTFQDYHKEYNWRKIENFIRPGEVPVLACLSGDTYEGMGGDGGLHMNPYGPHPLVFKYGWMGGTPRPGSMVNNFGPAPVHRGKTNFLFADWHVETRNVSNENKWPWYGKFDGSAFHPRRTKRSDL